VLAGGVVASLPMSGMIDIGAERERLNKELAETRMERSRAEAQLSNESFVLQAPETVVDVQRNRLARALGQIAVIERRLADLDE
jgi:valyl-tRNA synthetase